MTASEPISAPPTNFDILAKRSMPFFEEQCSGRALKSSLGMNREPENRQRKSSKPSSTMISRFSSCRTNYPPSLFILLLALALVNTVFSQSVTNPLVPEIDPPGALLEQFTSVTFGCKLILLDNLPPDNQFPLSWSRSSGQLPSGAVTNQNMTVSGTATTYYSSLTFIVTASVNNDPITCNAVTPTNSGSTSYTPLVILRAQQPTVTGPTSVRAGDVQTWTCVTDGASLVSPNVYWRNGQGEALITGVNHATSISGDSYNNRLFSVTSTLTIALPAERALYRIRCVVIHEYQSYSYSTEQALSVTVLFPPQLTKQSGDTVFTTEEVKQVISCVISASSPAATMVSWSKDGQPVDYSSGRYEVVSVTSPSLVITTVQKSDEGQYVCSATNAEGTTSFDTPTTLVVRYLPRINYPDGTAFQASLGSSFTLPCPVDAIPDPTTIRWKKISTTGTETYINIQTDSRYSGSTAQATGLTISPVQSGDQGSYACEADNDVGPGVGPTITLVVNSQPVITTPPASLTGSENNPLILPCEVTPLDSLQSVTWQKDGVNLVISNNPAKYSGGTVLVPSLIIQSPTDSDSGSYRCVATNQYGTTSGGNIAVDIQYAPRLTVETQPISTSPGPSISLDCQVQANPAPSNLYWTKRGVGPIVSAGSSKYIGGTAGNPTLTIINTEFADAGEYFCTVTNDVGTTASSNVVLTVIATPDVTVSPPSAVVAEGAQSLILTCQVVASPPAEQVVWTKDGELVDLSITTTASSSGLKYAGGTTQTPSLTIYDVQRTDAGIYACAATNSEGIGTSPNLRVDVTYPPTLTVPSTTVVGARGSSLTLTCGVEAFPPLTSLKWVKDGVDVDLSRQTLSAQNKYSGGTLAVPNLTITNLDENTDSGTYACVAENARGTVTSDPITTAVSYDPVINVPSSVTSQEGQSFTITCDIQMYPAPNSLTWFKDNTAFDPTALPNKYQGGTLAVPSLTVFNPTGSDSGVYKCRAGNADDVIITSPDVPVSVIYAPKVTASTNLVTRDQGQSVTLQVSVDAVPTPTSVVWQTSDIDNGSSLRINLPITGRVSGGSISAPSVTITGLQPSDAAYYYVTVTNDEGSTTAGPIPLRVRYQPTNIQVTASPSTLQAGNSLTLTCSAEGWPEITSYTWTRSGDEGITLATGSVYTKSEVNSDDWDLYRCSVTNAVGTQSATVRPNIQFAPTQTSPGVVLETAPIGGSVTLNCDVRANPAPSYLWFNGANIIQGATGSTLTLPIDAEGDFGSYSCSAQNTIGTLNPAVQFAVQESDEPNIGASTGGDDTLSTATIILIIIIVIIFLIIIILAIIFCCMQGMCAKWCGKNKETAKVAPTTYQTPRAAPPPYMNGGMVGPAAQPTTKVTLDDEPYTNVDGPYQALNPGAIISVPEKQGPRAHYLPPLTSESENLNSYHREEKRRSRRKKRQRRQRAAEDKDALTGAEGGEGNSPTPRNTTPGRSGDFDYSHSNGRAQDNVYEN